MVDEEAVVWLGNWQVEEVILNGGTEGVSWLIVYTKVWELDGMGKGKGGRLGVIPFEFVWGWICGRIK